MTHENMTDRKAVLAQVASSLKSKKVGLFATRKTVDEALAPFKGASMADAMILVNTVLELAAERIENDQLNSGEL